MEIEHDGIMPFDNPANTDSCITPCQDASAHSLAPNHISSTIGGLVRGSFSRPTVTPDILTRVRQARKQRAGSNYA